MSKDEVLLTIGPPSSIWINDRYKVLYYSSREETDAEGHLGDVGKEKEEDGLIGLEFGADGRLISVHPQMLASKLWKERMPKVGMTEKQVRALLGRPAHTRESKIESFWDYDRRDGTSYGVCFDRSGRLLHRSHGLRPKVH